MYYKLKIEEAISTVLIDPLHPRYNKDLPNSYKAVEIGERYRLFFQTFQEYQVVYFSWVNDEHRQHRSGDINDTYQEFRRLFGNGEIAPYNHESVSGEVYSKNTSWGAHLIYVQFVRETNMESYEASGNLLLSQFAQDSYKIISISVDVEGERLASGLLCRLCKDADQHRITLAFELITSSNNLLKSRHLLQKFGFILLVSDSDLELWERKPKVQN